MIALFSLSTILYNTQKRFLQPLIRYQHFFAIRNIYFRGVHICVCSSSVSDIQTSTPALTYFYSCYYLKLHRLGAVVCGWTLRRVLFIKTHAACHLLYIKCRYYIIPPRRTYSHHTFRHVQLAQ